MQSLETFMLYYFYVVLDHGSEQENNLYLPFSHPDVSNSGQPPDNQKITKTQSQNKYKFVHSDTSEESLLLVVQHIYFRLIRILRKVLFSINPTDNKTYLDLILSVCLISSYFSQEDERRPHGTQSPHGNLPPNLTCRLTPRPSFYPNYKDL